MRDTKIITHGGTAHRDEFLACCAVLFHEYATNRTTPNVVRRLALQEDLNDPYVYVIDTGGIWDPERRNFDHHQYDPRLVDRCALDLVLESLMPEKVMCGFARGNDWLRLTAVQDTRGSAEAAKFLGVTPRIYASTRSPMERAILKWFSGSAVIHADTPLHCAMREIGRTMLADVTDTSAQIAALEAIPGPLEVEGIRLWDIRDAWDSEDRNGFGVINEMASRLRVDVVVSHNSRNRKVGLYRQDWASSRVDLARIAEHPKHYSSHVNGFYAVVDRDVKDFELIEMIKLAVCLPSAV